MFKKASVVTGIILAGVFSAGELAAQSAPKAAEGAKAMAEGSGEKKMEGSGAKTMGAGTVFLNETFDSFDIDSAPTVDQLQRCLLYTSPSPRDKRQSRMPSSA